MKEAVRNGERALAEKENSSPKDKEGKFQRRRAVCDPPRIPNRVPLVMNGVIFQSL